MTHTLSAWKRLPLLSELALVVVLAWMVAGWLLPENETTPALAIKSIETVTYTLPQLNNLIATSLFGHMAQAVQPVAAVVPKIKNIAIRPLNLKLLGTVVAGDHSAAIIAISAGGKQSAFFIGDRIQSGVTLQAVETNAIVVDYNGVLQRISLEQGKKITSMPMLSAMPATIRSTAMQASRFNQPASNQPAPQNLNQRMDRNQLQRQLQNLPALLSQALARPNFSNGKMNGFIISNIVPGSLYAQAGLQNGDIIMAINGQKITNAAQAMGIYATLKSAPSLDLQLQRGSGIQNIHFDIR